MTDNLGQSQVLPYLVRLSSKGHRFVLLSFEKREVFEARSAEVAEICKSNNIDWVPLKYTKFPPVISTVWDVIKMIIKIKKLQRLKTFDLVHCRSYIAAIGGVSFKKKYNIPFVFDMRGFYADERVDGGIWNLKNPIFKMVYNYFKRKEKQFLNHSAYNISLTQAGAEIIKSWKGFAEIPLKVIPCCADLNFFKSENISDEKLVSWREKLNISKSDFLLSYLGSLGTWYLSDEMLGFFKRLQHSYPNAKFIFITPDSQESIVQLAQKHCIPIESLRIIQAKRSEVPELLKLSHISIFFIKPVYSKKASSPVKMGEILSMGIPVIANCGVGDVDYIIEDTNCGVLVEDFNENSYDIAIKKMVEVISYEPEVFINAAEKYYSLANGVESYQTVYEECKF